MDQTQDVQNPLEVQPEGRKFPIEGSPLARILSDPQFRQSFHARLKRSNPLIVAVYRIGLLPLFGVSRTVMLLTTKGHKSGKLRSTPIGYFRIGGGIYLFSAWGKGTSWYKNLVAHPGEVWIQIGLRRRAVRAVPLEDPGEIKRLLAEFIHESPDQARSLFGWDAARDRMEDADLSQVIERVLIVRFMEVQE